MEIKEEENMTEAFLQLPRKMLSDITRQDLGHNELKVMLIIVEEYYGWHKEKRKLSASYIARALLKEVTHSNLNIINKALKKLKTKDFISYDSNSGKINEIGVHPDFIKHTTTNRGVGTIRPNHQPRSWLNHQPGSCISKDISKDKNNVSIAGPVGPALKESYHIVGQEEDLNTLL